MDKNKKFYNLWFKKSWPYVTGAVLLSIIQIVVLATTKEPLGISRALANWGAWIYEGLGGEVENWYYFKSSEAKAAALKAGFLRDPITIRNLGIILGASLATLLASQFRIRKIKSIKQVIGAIIGGLLMGYGARIASGCNIGGLYSQIASLSLAGWVYALFLFLGAIVGSKLLIKYFM